MLRAGWNGLCRVSYSLWSKPQSQGTGVGVRSYSNKPTRSSGTWEKIVYKGYNVESYVPNDLPPVVDLSFSHPALGVTLQETLKEADENLAELKTKSKSLPQAMHSAFLKKEAVCSCQFDLNTRSLSDMMKQSCGFMPLKKASEKNEFDEVLQYVEALQLGLRLVEKEPLSVEMMETLHKAAVVEKSGHVSTEQVSGKLRTSHLAINGAAPAAAPFSSAFFPPAPKHVKRLLDNLVQFMNEPSDVHPLLKMGISHAQLENIQPFVNGNSQLCRLLLSLKILQSGIVDKFSLYPSYAFKVCRWLYLNSLQEIRANGVWEPWLQFFLGSISHTTRDAIELCDALTALHERNRAALRGNSRRVDIDEKKTDKLLDISYRMPYITKQTVALLFGDDYSVARELLDLFTRRGVLEVVRDERSEVWYHNKAVIEELNKERHIATAVKMLGGWMKVPAKIEANETIVTHTQISMQESVYGVPVGVGL